MANVKKDSVSPPPSPLPAAAAANDDTKTATERPLLKKTKIKSSSTSDDTHFPGPLFPSSRRTAAPPLMPSIHHLRPPPSVKLVGGEFVETFGAHDVIGRLMIQCALQPGLAQGNGMCIKPAEFYLFDQEEIPCYEIVIRVLQRNEIVIGHRLANTERAIINPPEKSQP